MHGRECGAQCIQPPSYTLLHFGDVQLDVRLEFQVFLVGRVDFIFNVVLEIGHLQ